MRSFALALAVLLLTRPAAHAATANDPLLVDAVGTGTNGNEVNGNGFLVYLPQAALAGNAVICGVTYPYSASRTLTITDNASDAWSKAVSVNNGTNNTQAIYYAANVAAGAQKITFTFDSEIYSFQAACKEAYNIATTSPLDATSSAANVTGTTIASGGLTTTAANDLIVQYSNFVGSNLPLNSQTATSFTEGSGWARIVADAETGEFFQDIQQSQAGAITPSYSVQSGATFGTVAAAFKTNTGAGTPPPASGIHIDHEWTFTTESGVTENVMFPTDGNFVSVSITDTGGSSGNGFVKSDSLGNTWTLSFPDESNILIYAANAKVSLDEALTIANPVGGNTEFVLRDIRGVASTSPIDTTADVGGTQGTYTPGFQITNAPVITPSAAGELIILAQQNGCGPPQGVTSPAGVTMDSVYFTGQIDADFMDEGEGHAHFMTTSNAPISFTWTMDNPNCAGQGGNYATETAWAIKPGSSSPTPPTISAFTATPSTISSGQASTLNWNVSNTTDVVISGVGDMGSSTFTVVSPLATTTYTLTAYGTGGAPASQSVTVTVTAGSPGWSTLPVDLLVSMNTSSPGTTLTAAIMNAGTVAGSSCVVGTSCTWGAPPNGAFSVGADQSALSNLGPVAVNGGPTYAANTLNYNNVAYNTDIPGPGTNETLNVSGSAATATSVSDVVGLTTPPLQSDSGSDMDMVILWANNGDYAVTQFNPQACGSPASVANFGVRIEVKPTAHSPCIHVLPQTNYYFAMYYNFTSGLASLYVYTTSGILVSSTSVVSGDTGGTFSSVTFGNNEGGFTPGASYFQNLMLNWTTAPNPLFWAGGSGSSPTPPTVAITAPANNASVSGTIVVSGTASGAIAVSSVAVSVDGGTFSPATGTTNWTFSLDTTQLSNGNHTLTAEAWNSSGLSSTTAISMTVNNTGSGGTPPPGTPWSGILATSRAIDWSQAGVIGGIPNRTSICTTLTSAATSAQINSAISSCSSGGGGVVLLSSGTYSGATSGFSFNGASNVTVRGAGADQTFLAPTSAAITVNSADNNWRGNPENLTAWSVPAYPSGTYPQGTNQITLATVANLKVGNPIILDQLDPTTDFGGIIVSQATTAQNGVAPGLAGPYSTQGSAQSMRGPGNGACDGSATCWSQEQIVTVTSCNGVTTAGSACSGANVVVGISPGLEMPNWSAAQTPEAWWAESPALNDGVEDLSLDLSGCSGCEGVNFFNAQNSWVKGVRSINSSGEGQLRIEYGNHISIVNNYMAMSAGGTGSYGAEAFSASDCLIENNIMQGVTTPQISNGTTSGCVFGYNYSVNGYYTPSPGYNIPAHGDHGSGVGMVLVEGNIANGATADNIHGTANLNTHFRNYFTGPQPACYASGSSQATATYEACNNNVIPEQLWAFHRFYNLIGNILGTTGTNTIYTSASYINGIHTAVIGENYGDVNVPSDPNVSATLMLWGNADSATGFGSPRFNCSEVPTALTGVQAPFSNPCPASNALPASFYYSSKPAWWPSGKPWPPIGPDVASGNVSVCTSGTYLNSLVTNSSQCAGGTSSAVAGGHANSIPAMDCYLSLGGLPNGTGPALTNFNAAACYGSSSTVTPPTVATPASANPNPVTGTSTSLSVLGADATGESNLTYTWSSIAGVSYSANGTNAAKNTTATFTQAGAYNFQVVIMDTSSLTVTSSVIVTVNQTVSSIAVSPLTATVQVNGTHQFTATAQDQFNHPMAVEPAFSWAVSGGGVISSTGTFTAGSTAGGPFNVTASANGITSLAAEVIVTTAAPPAVTLNSPADGATFTAPATINLAATVTPGTNPISQVQFLEGSSVLQTYSNPTTTSFSYSWTNVGAGTYPITAVVTDNEGLTNASNVATITVNAPAPPPPLPPPPSGPGTLPAINPGDLPVYTGLNDSLSITNYPDSNVSFVWSFTLASFPAVSGGESMDPQQGHSGMTAGGAATASFSSGAKTNSLVSYGLQAGTYQVSVYAQDSSGDTSPTLTASITLVNADLTSIRVYPNPWRSDKHAGKNMVFDQLPANCTIKLYTVSGHKVREFDNVNGSVSWDLTNDSGDKVGSGIYIYLITDSQGDKTKGKLAVIK